VSNNELIYDCLFIFFTEATKSSYQANTQIQEFLVGRLAKPHHNTKFKALLIIKVFLALYLYEYIIFLCSCFTIFEIRM
jgi:hypothetical protein